MKKEKSISIILSTIAAVGILPACQSATTAPPPSYQVEIRMGTLMPDQGKVGDYEVSIEQGYLSFADFAIYGAYLDTATAAFLLDGPILAHAGHQHGEADLTGEIDGAFAIDLTKDPALLATIELTEGHYFDGRIRLVTAGDASLMLPDMTPVSTSSPLSGHTFYVKGTATDDQGPIQFEFTVDAEATVPGLAYAKTITETSTKEITTRLDLGVLFDGIDFRGLASDGVLVVDDQQQQDTYLLLKAHLNDPASYVQDDLEAPN